MTTTVVIPCLNEEAYLPLLLEDLARQTLPAEGVIVADCHSTDATVQKARAFERKLPIKVVQAPIRSAASARNTGAKAARTDFILFLDADMRIPPDFIERLVKFATSGQLDFVTPLFWVDGHHPFDKLLVAYLNAWIVIRKQLLRKTSAVGGVMYVRRSLHQAAGGYNPQLREFDDVDYIARIQTQHAREGLAWRIVATTSNRRMESQGRLFSMLQGIPTTHVLTRRVIRPWMKRRGLKGKWED